jgi:hypothetical protein
MSYNPINPNGQTTKANSTPVTLASDQNNALETGGNLASISTNLTNGSQATKITDSLGHNANVIPLANYKPLAVGMVDGNGDQITSFGGGVQYTYGDVPDGTATGTLSMQVDTASGVAIPLFAVQGATKVSLVNSNDGSSFVGSKASSSSLPVVIASDQSTLPISGTVTANIGTADGISTSAIQTNGNQITQVKDASANALQVAQGSTTFGQTGPIVQTATTTSAPTYTTGKTNPLSTDTSGNLRTTISNASIPITSSGTLTVSDSSAGTTATNTTGLKDTVGTLSAGTAATKSLAVGGVYNSSAPTPTTGQQLSLQLDSSGNLKISGTVTANLGTIDGAATATNQTDGSQKTKIVDGSGNVIGATSNALDVNIKSGGSGGTQYTNSSAQATPTGTVALGYDGTNVRGLLTDNAGKLQTNITNSSIPVTGTFYQAIQPVSGTITANIGTAGALALDATLTGGTAKSIVRGGVKGTTTATDITSTAEGANNQAMDVQIYHGGTAKDPTNIRALTSTDVVTVNNSTAGNLKVDLSGTITNANAINVSLASNNPTLQASTAIIGKVGFDQTNPGVTNGVQINAALPSGSNTIGSIINSSFIATQSTASSLNATVVPGNATGSAVPSFATPHGFQARTSELATTAQGNNIIGVTDKVGKQIILPYANPENFASAVGSATATGNITLTTSFTTTGGLKNYITGFSLSNTGITTSLITILNGAAGSPLWYTIAPAGGGSNFTFPTPIVTSAATAPYVSITTASTTIYVSLTGYIGA